MKTLTTLAVFVSAFSVFAEHLNTPCTVEEQTGNCIPIRDCKRLFSILQQLNRLSTAQIEYLRKFHCGFESNHPLVCCLGNSSLTDANDTLTSNATNNPPSDANNDDDNNEPAPQDVSRHRNIGLINQSCGQTSISMRIVNGEKSDVYEYPWMARLKVRSWRGDRFVCGGTVINARYILTAAHCIPKNQSTLVSVSLGYHELSEEDRCETTDGVHDCVPHPQNIDVGKISVHPLYDTTGAFSHDIALLRLTSPAELHSETVTPICLPVELSKQNQNLEGVWLTVAGWGQTTNQTDSPNLLQVNVPVVNTAKCQELWQRYGNNVSNSQLCAGDTTLIRGSCRGDSGGPFMTAARANKDLRMTQYGIISYGPGSCTNNKVPVVYTRVGHYMKWILNTLRP